MVVKSLHESGQGSRTLELITLVSREEPNVITYITTHPLGVITSIGSSPSSQ